MKPTAHLKEVTFVNIHGIQVSTVGEKAKRPPPEPQSYHKGWRVTGFSVDHLAQAKKDHELEQAEQKRKSHEPKPWDESMYMRTHNGKPVRSKPYQIREAAQQCAEMAEKAGWQGVQVIEIRREVQKALA